MSSHLNLLEAFDPNKPNDLDKWIPTGLYYDLMDTGNEIMPIIDGADGYSNAQFFNALDGDIQSIPQFKYRMILENGINSNLSSLFSQYHY